MNKNVQFPRFVSIILVFIMILSGIQPTPVSAEVGGTTFVLATSVEPATLDPALDYETAGAAGHFCADRRQRYQLGVRFVAAANAGSPQLSGPGVCL